MSSVTQVFMTLLTTEVNGCIRSTVRSHFLEPCVKAVAQPGFHFGGVRALGAGPSKSRADPLKSQSGPYKARADPFKARAGSPRPERAPLKPERTPPKLERAPPRQERTLPRQEQAPLKPERAPRKAERVPQKARAAPAKPERATPDISEGSADPFDRPWLRHCVKVRSICTSFVSGIQWCHLFLRTTPQK